MRILAAIFILGCCPCQARPHEDFHLTLGGDCQKLQEQIEGGGDSATKLQAFNDFLTKIGVKDQFWSIIEEAKADAAENLPSESAKAAAAKTLGEIENGDLLIPHAEAKKKIHAEFEALEPADREAIKKLAKKYGLKLKDLVKPALPENCRATAPGADEAVAAASAANGFDNV
ncbi:unnamed protein product [Caenorhabditis bovis]|uniref:DUF148 domain-containing protein n=1 Tax=Caenorhabditis bovis TaxID=2654633 RepID=A0A8S1F075_9PELO|nr:unnamed protein product [Caenorhabditis bovis]